MRFIPREQVARCPPRSSSPPSHDSPVSFFLATGFRWQACISQNSITWHESVHPVMGNARGRSSRSAKTRSSANLSRYTLRSMEKGNEKRFDGCTGSQRRPDDKSRSHKISHTTIKLRDRLRVACLK